MSTELYVYADADAPPPGDDLLDGHDDREWEIALVRDPSSLEPVRDVDGCFALAWAAGSPRAVKIRSAIEERDAKRVIRTNAVRNDLSEEFQAALWLPIGAIVQGICEDPENVELIDTTEEG